jgi:ubiquitin C-terminal hydrolase
MSCSLTVHDSLQQLYKSLELPPDQCRVWIKKESDDDDVDSDAINDNSSRKLTPEFTDVDGQWRYLRSIAPTVTLQDFDMVSVELMIEQKAVHSRTGTHYWPKDELLNEWKHNLRRGDLLDARDEHGTWYESVVSSVNTHGKSVTIHFKGWGKKFDRDLITASELNTEIAPLYTKTENWRDQLKIYDRVDYTKHGHEDKGRKWLPAYVMALDHATGLMKLKYREDSSIISEVDGVDLYGESICNAGTHVKPPVANFASFPVTGSRSTSGRSSASADYTTPTTSSHYSSSAYTSLPSTSTTHYSSTSGRYGYGGSSWNTRSHAVGTPEEPGIVGLYNLGNTCFMNSMLQCLSNTKLLTDCFLNDSYASQINTQNPLGHGGKLATSYARLMKEMWSGKYVAVSPDEFKRTIGEFAPQFSGYQQQDSQELMLFLLDGLHEDLNRIANKPFVEKIESKGRDDDLISREAWRRFLLRNDSELVDKCFGQLRSHVTCTNCGYQSVTFDEYSSLSLPLPIKNTVEVEVIVYPLPIGSVPIKLALDVDGLLSVKDFKNLVASKLHLGPGQKKRKTIDETMGENRDDSDGGGAVAGDFVMVEGNSSTQSTDSPDGYESDLAELGDRDEAEGEVGGSAVIVVNSGRKAQRSDAMELEGAVESGGGGFFHVCETGGISMGNGSRIMKTFEDRTIVKELARLREPCVMFELQHDAPSTLPYTGSYQSSIQSVRYFDVLMATVGKSKSYYSAYSSVSYDLNGPPHRFSYLTAGSSYQQIQELIWTAMRCYLHPDSPYQRYSPTDSATTDCPYDIHLSNSYGSISKGLVTAKPSDPFVMSPYDALMCVWKDDAVKEEHFNEAAVEAVNDHTSQHAPQPHGGKPKGGVHVLDCLNKFIEREQMPPEETWYCPSCKQHLAPIKKFDVWTAPDILIIHLKRFQYVPGVYFVHREKLCDVVQFPITGLDLTDYVKCAHVETAPPVYDLYGVSEHIGGMGGGHYTATAMNPLNNKW